MPRASPCVARKRRFLRPFPRILMPRHVLKHCQESSRSEPLVWPSVVEESLEFMWSRVGVRLSMTNYQYMRYMLIGRSEAHTTETRAFVLDHHRVFTVSAFLSYSLFVFYSLEGREICRHSPPTSVFQSGPRSAISGAHRTCTRSSLRPTAHECQCMVGYPRRNAVSMR